MSDKTITEIIREAIIENLDRGNQFDEIQEKLGCSRQTAKSLFYAFIYYAKEDHLQDILVKSESYVERKPLYKVITEGEKECDHYFSIGDVVEKGDPAWDNEFYFRRVSDGVSQVLSNSDLEEINND